MTDELENLRPEVREAYATLDAEVSPPGRVSYEAYRAWCTIHAELLRLAGVEAQLGEVCSIWTRDKESAVRFLDRAEKAEAELAALKARIFQGIVLDVDDLARGHAGLPSEWRGKRVRLVVEGWS